MIPVSIICGLLVVALVYRESQHSKHIAQREKTWDLERGSLLTRIQHPEVIAIPRPVEINEEELVPGHDDEVEERDEIDLIGTVVDGVENG